MTAFLPLVNSEILKVLLLSVPAHAFRGHGLSLLVSVAACGASRLMLVPLESAPSLQATQY